VLYRLIANHAANLPERSSRRGALRAVLLLQHH
jgi:hypothetical protein